MGRSDNCNLLRASGGARVLWEQTNRGGSDQESLRVLVPCFERFLFPLRCTSLGHWIQNCLLLADGLVGDRNWRAIPANRANYSDERSGSSSLCIAGYASFSAGLLGPLLSTNQCFAVSAWPIFVFAQR